jgi:hypothetical protein
LASAQTYILNLEKRINDMESSILYKKTGPNITTSNDDSDRLISTTLERRLIASLSSFSFSFIAFSLIDISFSLDVSLFWTRCNSYNRDNTNIEIIQTSPDIAIAKDKQSNIQTSLDIVITKNKQSNVHSVPVFHIYNGSKYYSSHNKQLHPDTLGHILSNLYLFYQLLGYL